MRIRVAVPVLPAFVGLLAFLAAGDAGVAPARAEPQGAACERVVLVVFGGGVRTKEFLGRPDLCPTVKAIGAAGIASAGWRVGGADHEAAVETILTGRAAAVTTGEGGRRPAWPTVLEAARKGLALREKDVWYASYADGDALALAASGRADVAGAAPSIAAGDGPFSEALRPLFALYGRPNPTKERAWGLLASMRAASLGGSGGSGTGGGTAGDAGSAVAEDARVERALLEEVDRRAVKLSGPTALDARAVRAGIAVLRVFRPRLLVVRLGQADVAHRDLATYWDVLKRNDADLARLRAEIAGDPVLRTGTALIVCPEMGRNAAQNATGGYDHDDGSEDAGTVALVAEGAGIRRGATPRGKPDLRDVAPTVARLLGFAMPTAEGTAREELLAPRR
jgi:hypothetical protein